MFKKTTLMTMNILLTLMVGCSNMWSSVEKGESVTEVSVLNYTGQGFKLDNGEQTDKIAENHRDEIITSVEDYFQKEYKTKVKVHNVVGASEAASVLVESLGEPHFYTYAIVPIDVKEEKILTDKVWSQEGQIEGAIMDGIYGMIQKEEFKVLDTFLKDFTDEHPVVGLRKEAIEKAAGNGFMTPFYYATVYDKSFTSLYEQYMENPNTTSEEWENAFSKTEHQPKDFIITIHLYMKEKGAEPEQKIFDQLKADIEKMEGLPMGAYSLLLHDNTVDKTNAINSKDNTLETFDKDYIIKQ